MMNFKSKLYNIMNDLQGYKRNKSELMEIYIQKRLDENVSSYIKNINQSSHFLETKSEITVIKNMKGQ